MSTPADISRWLSTVVFESIEQRPAAYRLRYRPDGQPSVNVGRWDWSEAGGPAAVSWWMESAALAHDWPTGSVRVYCEKLDANGKQLKPHRTRIFHMTDKSHPVPVPDSSVEVAGTLEAVHQTLTKLQQAHEVSTRPDGEGALAVSTLAVMAQTLTTNFRDTLGFVAARNDTQAHLVEQLTRQMMTGHAQLSEQLSASAVRVAKAETALQEERAKRFALEERVAALAHGNPDAQGSALLTALRGLTQEFRGGLQDAAQLYSLKERKEAHARRMAALAEGKPASPADENPEAAAAAALMEMLFGGHITPHAAATLMLQQLQPEKRAVIIQLAASIVSIVAETRKAAEGENPTEGGEDVTT